MLKNKLLSAMGGAPANYIEDVFSTYLYTGNGSTQTITNGIDLAGKGGLIWIKSRTNQYNHCLFDTQRGVRKYLFSNLTNSQFTDALNGVTAFNSNGFTVVDNTGSGNVNQNSDVLASWTFRKQPKFFDVVTYTGNGASTRNIPHSLGSVPGCIFVKRIDAGAEDWLVYHKDITTIQILRLNLPNAATTIAVNFWGVQTSTDFVVGSGGSGYYNVNGAQYVAYLFAHNAGGFGLSGTDNVISCGSYTGNGSNTGPVINLGYEPQWLMVKNASQLGQWEIYDSMRGLTLGIDSILRPNTNGAEAASVDRVTPIATGFYPSSTDSDVNASGDTYVYIAIRRGPMKVPTTGTSVFSPITAANSTGTVNTTGFPVDLQLERLRTLSNDTVAVDRLRGVSTTTTGGELALRTNLTAAEVPTTTTTRAWDNTGFQTASGYTGYSAIYWNFRRAPGFFDEVCYTGTGVARTVTHNLAAVPELMIVKQRSSGTATGWAVYTDKNGANQSASLNLSDAFSNLNSIFWNSTAPTLTQFTVGTNPWVNTSAATYIAYLFASCPGVSKVFSFTGNGSSQTINCGFTGGARFVMIKRTDSTGDWYVWDTARGIVANNDPYLSLNTTAAEVTTDDTIDTDSTGFIVNQVSATNVNVNGATYIGLAIA